MKEITIDINKNPVRKTKHSFWRLPSRTKITKSPTSNSNIKPDIISIKKKHKSPGKWALRILLILLFAGTAVAGYLGYRSNKALNFMGIDTNPSTTIANVIKQKNPELKKDEQDRTNMLIVGVDTRPSDPGLQNTDTIMIASYNHTTNNLILISIPRDILAAYPDNQYYFTKINAIYNYCERYNAGTGMECLSDTVKTITGLTIHYSVMVDIAGMVAIIDKLEGIDVDVERSFTDYMFPSAQNTYEIIHFDAGLQHMDGETAMKYSRSRHAQSIEGSDYARARRQQKVVMAAKDKALTMDTLKNPLTVVEILEELGSSITISEIMTEDIRAAIALSKKSEDMNVYNVVLDPALGNWQLISDNPAGPRAGLGDWSAVTTYLTMLYEHPSLYTTEKEVYVYNAGLGYNEAYQEYLRISESYPYLPIIFGGNSPIQTLTGTHVYNFDDDPVTSVLEEYSTFLGCDWSGTLPEGLSSLYGENIAILLGTSEPQVIKETEDPTPVTE